MHSFAAEARTLREAGHKYVARFEVWFWRGMEKNIWADRVRKEERNKLHRIKRRRDWS